MKSFLNKRQERNKESIKKEVKEMKKICALTIVAVAMIFATTGSSAIATEHLGVITDIDETIRVYTVYNAYGVAIESTTVTETTTTTEREIVDDPDTTEIESGTITSTTTDITTVKSSWRGSGLKTDSVTVDSDTNSSDGSTSSRDYTDIYLYDSAGRLVDVSGSGESHSTDSETGDHRDGDITRTFEVRDGQALLLESRTEGTISGLDGVTGTFVSTTTIDSDDYAYLGGKWVATEQTSFSSSEKSDGSSEEVTKILTFTRNDQGVITGMSQTAEGHRVTVTGNDDGTTSATHYYFDDSVNGADYEANFRFDEQLGWYLFDETIIWRLVEPDDSNPYDPWTLGTLQMIEGHLALVVDAEDVNGREFYNMDPSAVTGGTRTDEDGNMIFMLLIDDEGTEAELMGLIGKKINLMWQYYTPSSAEDASGYGWIGLAPTSDRRVDIHLRNDDRASVEQHGGQWDRTKQYVVID